MRFSALGLIVVAVVAVQLSCAEDPKPKISAPQPKAAVPAAAAKAGEAKAAAEKPAEAKEKKAALVKVDAALPTYKPAAGVTGGIKSVGSDTMNNLMTLWGEGFQKHYPSVKIGVEGKGTSTAMPALISGNANFGPMSREPKPKEIEDFKKQFGYEPTTVATALDMLAVFVHKDNPIKGLTFQQLDAVFSATRKLGGADDVVTWGQLGLTGEWEKQPISLYGRNAASGTYGYFKEHVLGNGDFKDSVKVQPGSSGVVQGVATDKFAIGYSGIGYATADVRAVSLAAKADGEPVEAISANAYNGKYPLARPLLLAVNFNPTKSLDPLNREFLKYILSKDGQQEVANDGYLPLGAKKVATELGKVGIK